MFNMGETLKMDIVMTVTTKTIKKVDQRRSCVELELELVWNLSRTPEYILPCLNWET